jgi:hypothetical protein
MVEMIEELIQKFKNRVASNPKSAGVTFQYDLQVIAWRTSGTINNDDVRRWEEFKKSLKS